MHIASDAFAHSSYDSNKAYIDHTNGNADNRWYSSYSRWQAANGVASDVFYCMKNNYEGDLQDFQININILMELFIQVILCGLQMHYMDIHIINLL